MFSKIFKILSTSNSDFFTPVEFYLNVPSPVEEGGFLSFILLLDIPLGLYPPKISSSTSKSIKLFLLFLNPMSFVFLLLLSISSSFSVLIGLKFEKHIYN